MAMASPLRIAVSSYYLPSQSKIGAGYMAHRLANEMVKHGHYVTMFSPCSKPQDALYEHQVVALRGRLRTFKWGWALRKLDLNGFDVLHAHGDNHFRGRRSRPPVVRTMHGSCLSEAFHIKGAKERLRMLLLGLTEVVGSITATKTVAVSKNTRHFYPWIRTVIPNGVDLSLFHPGEKDPSPTILFVGTYRQRKRGKLLMDIFEREIRPAVPDAKLWMVCSDAPPAAGVEVLGRLSDAELADRYRRAWVFCLPSTYEGFGVPYIEAMASRTAVVASPNPGAKEIVGADRIVRDRDLGRRLTALLSDQSLRESASQDLPRLANRYSWASVVEAYDLAYTAIVKE